MAHPPTASAEHPLLRHAIDASAVEGLADEAGEPYVLVPLELPEGMLVEIDDGTFGQLVGLRLYGPLTQSDC